MARRNAQQCFPNLDLQRCTNHMQRSLAFLSEGRLCQRSQRQSGSSMYSACGQRAAHVSHCRPQRRFRLQTPRPQIPFSVPITSARPKGLSNQPQKIRRPSPLRAYSPGLMASQRRNRSCSLPDPDNPTAWDASSVVKRSRSKCLCMPQAEVLLIALGGHTNPGRKQPLEMGRAHIHPGRQLLQCQILAAIVDELNRPPHDAIVV